MMGRAYTNQWRERRKKVGGKAVWSPSIAVFRKRVQGASGGGTRREYQVVLVGTEAICDS